MRYVVKIRNDDGEIEQFHVDADYHIVQGSKMIFMDEDKEVAEVNLDQFVDLDIDVNVIKEPDYGKR